MLRYITDGGATVYFKQVHSKTSVEFSISVQWPSIFQDNNSCLLSNSTLFQDVFNVLR